MLRSAACYLGIVLLWGTADTAVLEAQPTTIRLGGEFQANLYTNGSQRLPALAQHPDGSFMVVWHSAQDGSSYGIFARRFNAAGVPQGAEFQVNAYTTVGPDSTPRWRSTPTATSSWSGGASARTARGYGVFARRFNAAGVAAGRRVPGQHLHHRRSDRARGGDGQRRRLRRRLAQRRHRTARLRRLRPPLQRRRRRRRPTSSRSTPTPPATRADPSDRDGRRRRLRRRLASNGQDGVERRRLRAGASTAAGVAQGGEFQVNTYTTSAPEQRRGGHGRRRRLRRRLARASARTAPATASSPSASTPPAHRRRPSSRSTPTPRTIRTIPPSALDADGDFVVAWESNGQDGRPGGVFARRFNAAGVAAGGRVPGQHLHQRPSAGPGRGDGRRRRLRRRLVERHRPGRLLRRHLRPAFRDRSRSSTSTATARPTPLTDGLLVLRFLFGFTGATLVSGAIDPVACTRCNASAIEGYLQTLI